VTGEHELRSRAAAAPAREDPEFRVRTVYRPRSHFERSPMRNVSAELLASIIRAACEARTDDVRALLESVDENAYQRGRVEASLPPTGAPAVVYVEETPSPTYWTFTDTSTHDYHNMSELRRVIAAVRLRAFADILDP